MSNVKETLFQREKRKNKRIENLIERTTGRVLSEEFSFFCKCYKHMTFSWTFYAILGVLVFDTNSEATNKLLSKFPIFFFFYQKKEETQTLPPEKSFLFLNKTECRDRTARLSFDIKQNSPEVLQSLLYVRDFPETKKMQCWTLLKAVPGFQWSVV